MWNGHACIMHGSPCARTMREALSYVSYRIYNFLLYLASVYSFQLFQSHMSIAVNCITFLHTLFLNAL